MKIAKIPKNEGQRLGSIQALGILDTPAEERFDRVTRALMKIFDVPIAYVSIVDENRQWFKSKQGLNVCQTDRDVSFCSHAILQEEPLIISDATLDDRFSNNPMVIDDPKVRFYAGHPLKSSDGFNVGTLCAVDSKPREFTENDLAIFSELAKIIENEINLVDVIRLQNEILETREQLSKEIAEAADYVQSLLPAKIDDKIKVDWEFIPSSQLGGDSFGYHWIDEDHFAIYLVDVSGHGVGSALLSTSVLDVLRSQSLPKVDFRKSCEVLCGLNKRFQMRRQSGKFFTIWYGVYNPKAKTLTYSSAGHPPAVLFEQCKKNGVQLKALGVGGTAIGLISKAQYESETIHVGSCQHLYIYSDGIYEIEIEEAHRWSFEEFSKFLNFTLNNNSTNVEQIIDEVRKQQQVDKFVDDVSVIQLTF